MYIYVDIYIHEYIYIYTHIYSTTHHTARSTPESSAAAANSQHLFVWTHRLLPRPRARRSCLPSRTPHLFRETRRFPPRLCLDSGSVHVCQVGWLQECSVKSASTDRWTALRKAEAHRFSDDVHTHSHTHTHTKCIRGSHT